MKAVFLLMPESAPVNVKRYLGKRRQMTDKMMMSELQECSYVGRQSTSRRHNEYGLCIDKFNVVSRGKHIKVIIT